jgi:hypothetical protein
MVFGRQPQRYLSSASASATLGLVVELGRLSRRLLHLVWPAKTHPGNERLAQFLWDHRDDLFTFLREPGLDATNWRAEQAIRPAVVNRKVWGGNRTWTGAPWTFFGLAFRSAVTPRLLPTA